MVDEYIEIDVEVIHMTPSAVFISDGDIVDWVPLSQIKEDFDDFDILESGQTITIQIARWIAEQKGFI